MINWKGFGRKQSWPHFKVLSWHLRGGTEENHKNLQGWYIAWDALEKEAAYTLCAVMC
jgi:hypothetical protein